MERIVVVGGGQAGATLTERLRAEGHDGPITLICGEPVPPYQRPPLSKKYLLGEMDKERLFLRPEAFYAEKSIDLRLGQACTSIDRNAQTVSLNEDQIAYDALVLTTGSVPRHLPATIGGALRGVHVVRTLEDIDLMAPECAAGKDAVIVGGGYIGLEAAAVLAERGLKVTLLELAPRILQRVAAPETSDYFRDLHARHGVTVREGTGLERLVGDDHVRAAKLAGGEEIPADLVVVGIGIAPDTALAELSGLALENGIAVNSKGQTSDPKIWAAGDCASFPYNGGRIRLESVQNAIDQAALVARNLLGADEDYAPYPWFWSDQYDVKLQIAGLNTGYDRVALRAGETARSHWYYAGERLLAVDAMNDPRAYMVGKKLIEMGKSPPSNAVSDPASDLKALLKS